MSIQYIRAIAILQECYMKYLKYVYFYLAEGSGKGYNERERACRDHVFVANNGIKPAPGKKLRMKPFCNTKSVDMLYLVCDNELRH